jgi:hypothetical protein
MRLQPQTSGRTVIELIFTVALMAAVGLTVYALLSAGTILGAKNAAVNTAHQQARTAMLQMKQDLHSTVSLPQLVDANGAAITTGGPAAGISFQLWAIGPLKIANDASAGQNVVQVTVPGGTQAPVAGQRLIVPTHQIEQNITAVSNPSGTTYALTLASNLVDAISGTGSPTNYNIVCYITDRCSYIVQNQELKWDGPTTRTAFSVMGQNITSAAPFTTPNTPAGALYYRFVAAIDLSTADLRYSNRGFKSANILLNGQVPIRARLTTYQGTSKEIENKTARR